MLDETIQQKPDTIWLMQKNFVSGLSNKGTYFSLVRFSLIYYYFWHFYTSDSYYSLKSGANFINSKQAIKIHENGEKITLSKKYFLEK